MNKNTTVKNTIKMMATALLCATLCGTAAAAPRGNGGHSNDRGRNNAPQHQKAAPTRHDNRDNGRRAPQKAHRSNPKPSRHNSPAHRPQPVAHQRAEVRPGQFATQRVAF